MASEKQTTRELHAEVRELREQLWRRLRDDPEHAAELIARLKKAAHANGNGNA